MQPHPYSLTPKAASLEELIQKAKTFVAAAKAPATLKAHRNDWRDFETWCREHQLTSLPSTPETVALFIADRASTLASGTITRRLTSITKAHQAAGFTDSPATARHFIIGETPKGIRRTIGAAQHGKDPLLSADIRRIVAAGREDLLGLRDSAVVLVGFAGGFRRSELAGIHLCDLKFSADGVVVAVRKSKTDQEGAGREVGLPFGASQDTCPARALSQWLDRAAIREGPVFRSVGRYGHVSLRGLHTDSIGKLLKCAAGRAGLKVEELGGHSLRAGCVTQAAMNGVREFVIMRQTGHKTIATLRRYIRSGEIFRENAAAGLGIYSRCQCPGNFTSRALASCQTQDLQSSFKMVASVFTESVGSDFCAAHDGHALWRCSRESLIRLPLFCREAGIHETPSKSPVPDSPLSILLRQRIDPTGCSLVVQRGKGVE
jgi:integrase